MWGNAVAGSSFAAMKNEMYYRPACPGRDRARSAVAEYIGTSASTSDCLGYGTPAEVLADLQTTATAE